MASSCVISSSSRLVVKSTCRVRKTRTVVSSSHISSCNFTQGLEHGSRRYLTATNGYWRKFQDVDLSSGIATVSSTSLRRPCKHRAVKGGPLGKPLSVPSSRSIASASASMSSRILTDHQDEGGWDAFHLLLGSAALAAATLAFATATTSPAGATTTASASAAKFGRGGGGPGGTKPFSSLFTASSRERAEEDVRRLQLESNENPYSVSVGALQGARWTMEDEYSIASGGRFAAVFDGHGGSGVSSTLRDRLYDAYSDLLCSKHWEEIDDSDARGPRIPSISSHVAALRGALARVDGDVLSQERLAHQGSTAVAVVLHKSETGHRTLLSANVGDSRAILSRRGKAIDLTRDHKPNDERERARIMALGEEVQWDSYAQVHRVRNLSLSRAIGDKFARPAVSAEPDIRHFPVTDTDDEFVVLASDGLWDVMSSQEVVDFVNERLKDNHGHRTLNKDELETLRFVQSKSMARAVANEALDRGSPDNVCVLVVWLGEREMK